MATKQQAFSEEQQTGRVPMSFQGTTFLLQNKVPQFRIL